MLIILENILVINAYIRLHINSFGLESATIITHYCQTSIC